MKKNYNVILIILIITIMIVGCGSRNDSIERDNYLSKCQKINEEKQIDSYVFTLVESFYDRNTNSGYMHMSISSDENDVSKIKVFSNLGMKIATDEKLLYKITSFYGRSEIEYEYKDGKLEVYMLLVDDQEMGKGEIRIVNPENEKEIVFELPDSKMSECYQYGDKEIWISPISIFTSEFDFDKLSSLTLIMKNSEKIKIIEDGNKCGKFAGGSFGSGDVPMTNFCWFNKCFEYTDIDYLEIGNEKVERKN